MILQALTEYYALLAAEGKIAQPGWSKTKVCFALCLDNDGRLVRVADLRSTQMNGKKTVLSPKELDLPALGSRTSGVAAKFLCDHSGYLLGIDSKGNPGRTEECFSACQALHEMICRTEDSPTIRAILRFFRTWQPDHAAEHPILVEYLTDILAGGNLIFRVENQDAHLDPAIRRAWTRYSAQSEEAQDMLCLVTGERGPVEKIHPPIKNVIGAQSSGAALVSFNAPSFCSYGKEQSLNSPTSKYAAFAYTSALNHLLADREHVLRIGETTVVCWARGGGDIYQSLFNFALMGNDLPRYTAEDLRDAVKKLCAGNTVALDEGRINPNMDFYVLGLSPNAARLAVRFFLHNTFGDLLRNASAHQARLEIVGANDASSAELPLWKLMMETVNQNSRDKAPTPNMAGETLRAILNNTPYPATLLNDTMLRITAERKITRGRAAIIKAYYLKRPHPQIPKEVLTVSLNPDSTNVAYVLGRLFSVLESIQEAAHPGGINTTVKDRYFNAASATPARVFPSLLELAQKHLRKLNDGLAIYYGKQIGELTEKLGEEFPTNLSLPMKGSFQLGYYHQTQKRYEKKEEK